MSLGRFYLLMGPSLKLPLIFLWKFGCYEKPLKSAVIVLDGLPEGAVSRFVSQNVIKNVGP